MSRELRTERDKAKRASNEKSAFLAHISHEIRTALYVIIGILELEVRQLPENVSLHTVSRAANSLLGVIGDVLDFTRIESGKVTLNLQSVGLYALLEQCAEPFCAIAQDKGLGFTLELTIPKQNHYLLDATRITQVINNLLSNAVKFTDEGFITLRAAIQRSINSETEMLSLYVQDTGCGIPEHMYSEILQPYVQVEADSRGTLTISIQLMALMDGALTLEAAPGSGTLAHMYLSLKRSELQEEVSPTHIIQPEPLNILLVDDLPANLQVLSLQLASSKHRVTIAEGAEQALRLVEENYFDMD
ncbi:MAG: ATP-binding protein [Candidatus Arsenophonus phytopathogenicus]